MKTIDKFVDKTIDYFSGYHTIKYYNHLLKKFPKKSQEYKDYKDELASYIFLGKVLPTAMNIIGLISIVNKDYVFGSAMIIAGEDLKVGFYKEAQENKKEHNSKQKIKA